MSQETELIAALFAASIGPSEPAEPMEWDGLWHGFLIRLAEITQADSAMLRVLWPGSPPQLWQIGEVWEGPSAPVAERMRSGRVYSQIDFQALDPSSKAPVAPLRALRWRIGREGQVLLALRRNGPDFRALDGVQLANLTPYLGLALESWRQLRQSRLEMALDRQICAELGAGWILFSPAGQVLSLAMGLEERLTALSGIALRADGRLSLDPRAAQALHQALTALSRPDPVRQWLVLSEQPPLQLMLDPAPPAIGPGFLGRLRHGLSARALPPERLAQAFGLSRSEARLAARLCDGLSLAEAAAELGWTIQTTRSASKQLYARLGTNSQAGVVQRLLQSAIWLA